MLPLVRGSILRKFLIVIVVSCTLSVGFRTVPSWAQRAAVRTGGVGQMSAPPISRGISSAPGIRAPISAPRIWGPPAGGLSTAGFRPPRRPIRPFPPVLIVYESPFLFRGPFWGLNSCWSATCDLFGFWTFDYAAASSTGPINVSSQVNETPVYIYGEERLDQPQLVLKDGSILNVTDYWLVDDQLHFTMIEENGRKPVEHVIPFEALDLQATVDTNTRRGFRVVLRNEPIDQYLRDHPEGAPPIVTPPRE